MIELNTASTVDAQGATSPLADNPFLQQLQAKLRRQMTRQWPTRYLPLCPPAYAAMVDTTDLQVEGIGPTDATRTLVVYLPDDFEPHLGMMAYSIPELCIHPDISLQSNNAYLSWSIPAPSGQLSKALWIKVKDVLPTLLENEIGVGFPVLPIVFVAGETITAGGFFTDEDTFAEWEASLRNCAVAPTGYDEAELSRAKAKAEKYGEQPWLFMRYELKVENRRCAVNWAPVEQPAR